MSHFTVLVIGNDIESALAPYQENNMGDCPEEYLEFVDYTLEVTKEYEEDTYTEYVLPDDTITRYLTNEQVELVKEWKIKEVEVKYKDRYTLDEFAKKYHGYTKNSDWKYGYKTNPNSEWDWWVVGWRWAGNIIVKPGTTFETPNFSWGWSAEEKQKVLETLRTDSALLKDIDLDAMVANHIEDLTDNYNKLKDFDNLPMEEKIHYMFLREQRDYIDAWHTLEEFLEEFTRHPLNAYAYVHNGEWIYQWDMGWFGMSNDNCTPKEWNAKFTEFINGLDPETRITFVDCHV